MEKILPQENIHFYAKPIPAAEQYAKHKQKSLTQPEEYWQKHAEKIDWFEKPKQILHKDEKGFYHWFKGGKLNTSYLALDFHVKNGLGDNVAIYYDSPVTGKKAKITYREILKRVSCFAGGLLAQGVKKGDRVIIYMPMIPETMVAMLACARIGAIHSVVFGGFAAAELATRINDATPTFLITASCGIEITKVIDYTRLVDEAIELAHHKVEKVCVHVREENPINVVERGYINFADIEKGPETDPVWLDATDPLYILYTSGTTGKPKGIVRENGGHAVAMKYSMDYVYHTFASESYWAGSDFGWIVGHSYIVYAPLIQGCSTVVFEGKPVKTPDASAFWRVMSEYKVKTFFTAPTAFRAIKKEDSEGSFVKKYDLQNLQYIFLAGERLDPPTFLWLNNLVNAKVTDNWWQTETGWPIVASTIGIEKLPTKIGSAGLPVPGYDIKVFSDEGEEMPANESGNLAIKLPLTPGCLPTLWQNDERYIAGYLSFKEDYYLCGDGGYIDDEGYVYIMGRIDDVINVSGHRLSTGEMEEIIGEHVAVAECAVIGVSDELRGEVPISFSILKDNLNISAEKIEKELIALIREKIGAVACYKKNIVVKRLPKTRSGKILRKTMRQLTRKEVIAIPSTIDDPSTIEEMKNLFTSIGLRKVDA